MADENARRHAAAMRERYRSRKAAGLCPKCGKDRDSSLIYCTRCTAMVRASLERHKARSATDAR